MSIRPIMILSVPATNLSSIVQSQANITYPRNHNLEKLEGHHIITKMYILVSILETSY